jgi:hypothetical protein
MRISLSIIPILPFVLIASCDERDQHVETNQTACSNLYANDQHPDPLITIRKSESDFEEKITMPAARWKGNEYADYSLNCPSTTLARLIRFLFYDYEKLEAPEIVGVGLLPECLFLVDFDQKIWSSKAEGISDVEEAIEAAFHVEIDFESNSRLVRISKAVILPEAEAEQDSARQPATRLESKSEGGYKTLPEAEGRTR